MRRCSRIYYCNVS